MSPVGRVAVVGGGTGPELAQARRLRVSSWLLLSWAFAIAVFLAGSMAAAG